MKECKILPSAVATWQSRNYPGVQYLRFTVTLLFTLTNARGLNNPPSHPHPFFSLAWIPLFGNTEICSVDCGTHGVCMGGTCRCEEGWTGPACNQRACHPRCAEHGTCKDGKCECSQGWNGEHCTIGRPARLVVLYLVRFCLRWNQTHLPDRLAIHPRAPPQPLPYFSLSAIYCERDRILGCLVT